MSRFLVLLTLGVAFAADPAPREIVRRSLAADEKNWELIRDYTFLERVEKRDLNREGKLKSKDVKTYDVTLLEGSIYRRLVARDDKPLPAHEEAAEQKKLENSIQKRRRESPKKRARRIRQYEKKRNENRAATKEIPEAFEFRLLGEESVDSRPAYVIEATPRPGYKPRGRRAKLLTKLKGKIWIDKADYNWVRAEAELIDTVSFGWILVRLAKGAKVEVETTRVNDEVWLPHRVWFTASARIALLKRVHLEQESQYREFRKFQTDSRIVSTTGISRQAAPE